MGAVISPRTAGLLHIHFLLRHHLTHFMVAVSAVALAFIFAVGTGTTIIEDSTDGVASIRIMVRDAIPTDNAAGGMIRWPTIIPTQPTTRIHMPGSIRLPLIPGPTRITAADCSAMCRR